MDYTSLMNPWGRLLPASAPAPYRPLPGQRVAIALLIALLGVFYLATLRPGHVWGDDFAMYILQARNIASGNWTAPTGYIYNPRVALGPAEYPPLFPLMLSPLYRIWGLNLTPMKVEVILFFLAGLYLMFEFHSRCVPFPYAAGIVLAIGLSPYFWQIKESIMSDLPFFFFTFLTLGVISACDRQGWKSSVGACAAAACVYLSFATRTAGVVFLPCLLLLLLSRPPGEARLKVFAATALAVALIGLHFWLFRGPSSYLHYLGGRLSVLPQNLIGYGWHLRQSFLGLGRGVFSWAFLFVLVAIGGIGFLHRVRRGVSIAEAFTVSYLLMVLLWTSAADARLLIPLLPMWLLYIAVAVQSLLPRREFIVGGVLLAITLGGYAWRYSKTDFGPIREGLGDPAFARICDYIRGQTPDGSVFIFDRPRLLALVTGRHASGYQEPTDDRELWSYFSGIFASYVLIDREFPDDRSYLEPILLRGPARAHEIHVEGSFHLYALR